MIMTIKYIVFAVWVLITIPVIVLGINFFTNELLPFPKKGMSLFRYLVSRYQQYLNVFIIMTGTLIALKREHGAMTYWVVIQQIIIVTIITTLLLSIKYYKAKKVPGIKSSGE